MTVRPPASMTRRLRHRGAAAIVRIVADGDELAVLDREGGRLRPLRVHGDDLGVGRRSRSARACAGLRQPPRRPCTQRQGERRT